MSTTKTMPGFELIGEDEFREVADVFQNGGILFRHGFAEQRNNSYKVRDFEKAFATKMHVKNALAVSSGTAAIRVALAAFGIGVGDEVITQSFTFVATVEAIIESGATPICAEIDSTLNLDPNDLERRINSKTKAVIVVHMLGTPARLVEISEICKRRGVLLIEDTAWGCGGSLNNRPLGTWGDAGTYSFDFAKTITTGEGGMIVFRDSAAFKRAEAWHDHGHENNPNFPRWEDSRSSSGFNFRMMELQGAVGLAQLKKLSLIVEKQRLHKKAIVESISHIVGIEMRCAPDGSYETADALVFMVSNRKLAIRCRDELINMGLATKILPEAYTWHFAATWDHMTPLVNSHSGNLSSSFQKSHDLLSRAVALPVSATMNSDHPSLVRQAIEKALIS